MSYYPEKEEETNSNLPASYLEPKITNLSFHQRTKPANYDSLSKPLSEPKVTAIIIVLISLWSLWVDLTSLRRCSPRKIKLSTQSNRKGVYQFSCKWLKIFLPFFISPSLPISYLYPFKEKLV